MTMSSKQPPTKSKTIPAMSPGRPTKVGIDPRPPGALPAPPRPPSVFPAAGSAAYLPSLNNAGKDEEPVKPDQNATPTVESPTETLEELKSEFDRLPMLHQDDSP